MAPSLSNHTVRESIGFVHASQDMPWLSHETVQNGRIVLEGQITKGRNELGAQVISAGDGTDKLEGSEAFYRSRGER